MHKFTQEYYDCIMEYVAFNQRSAGIISTTKYTGLVRWHERNHSVYDHFNKKITKYIGNMYDEYATPKPVDSFSYSMGGNMMTHIETWHNKLLPMREKTKDLYYDACNESDFCLAGIFKHLNKTANNEILYLKRFAMRLKGAGESDIMIVNKIIHDYFEANPYCEEIDLSI